MKMISKKQFRNSLRTLKSVTLKYNITYITLYRHMKKNALKRSQKNLVRFLIKRTRKNLPDKLFYGLTTAESKKVVQDFAQKNAISHSFQNAATGQERLVDFLGDFIVKCLRQSPLYLPLLVDSLDNKRLVLQCPVGTETTTQNRFIVSVQHT